MGTRAFLNLPVKDLKRSVDFFGRLGFRFDPRFSDQKAACVVLGDDVCVMLLLGSFFETFTTRPIADARLTTEALVAVAVDSRAEVDRIADAAFAAGASAVRATEDHGFMYGRSFGDLDGHLWEIFWMDPARLAAGPETAGAQPAEIALTRIIEAPHDVVSAAWTRLESLQRWLPRADVTCREVAPGELVFTVVNDGEPATIVTLAATGRRTRVTVRQTVPAHVARGREQRWSESLDLLGALVQQAA